MSEINEEKLISEGYIDLSDDLVNMGQFNYVALLESVSGSGNGMQKVLGKIQGNFFCPDKTSRNERHYTRKLWEIQLGRPDINRSLQDGMLGTLIHPTEPKMAHPMYSSHVIKQLYIDGNNEGVGVAYIWDNPMGRIVDTFSKGTDEYGNKLMNLYVSSRAWGKYKEGVTHKGAPIVDEKNFIFKTFDIVMEPGFLEANPKFEGMLEQLSECYVETVMHDSGLSKVEKVSRAGQLLRDVEAVLNELNKGTK